MDGRPFLADGGVPSRWHIGPSLDFLRKPERAARKGWVPSGNAGPPEASKQPGQNWKGEPVQVYSDENSPASLLATLLGEQGCQGKIIVVTGPIGVGKTRWCQQFTEQAAELDLKVCGLLSLPVIQRGRKTGINLMDISSGARRRLAVLAGHQKGEHFAVRGESRWAFDLTTFRWGSAILRTLTACDLLVVDELGPLEFEGGEGLDAALEAISTVTYRAAVVVVRPKLLGEAQRHWPHAQVIGLSLQKAPRGLAENEQRD